MIVLNKETIKAELYYLAGIFQKNWLLNIDWKDNPFYLTKDQQDIRKYISDYHATEKHTEITSYINRMLLKHINKIENQANSSKDIKKYLTDANYMIENLNSLLIINQITKENIEEDFDDLVLFLENITRIPANLSSIFQDKLGFIPKQILINIDNSSLTQISANILNNLNIYKIKIEKKVETSNLTVDSKIFNIIDSKNNIKVLDNKTTTEGATKGSAKTATETSAIPIKGSAKCTIM